MPWFTFIGAFALLQSPSDSIVIDGRFEDWSNAGPALVDPADAPAGFVDLGEIRVNHDEEFVHLLIDFGRVVNAQGLNGTAMILLNADGDETTGREEHGLRGVDLIVDLTPPNQRDPNRPGMGVGLRSMTYQPPADDPDSRRLTPYDIGMTFAPTHAGRRMEFRFNRNVKLPDTPPLFAGERFTAKIVCVDPSGAIVDASEVLAYDLANAAALRAIAEDWEQRDPLARPEGADLRVMTWNAQHGAMFTKPEPFARILSALKPDVILLQELEDDQTAHQVKAFLEEVPETGGASWNVVFAQGGGDLRCAVASTRPIEAVAQLDLVPYPDRPDRFVRVVGASIDCGERRLLAVSVHLRCCGRIGSPEDETRKVEAETINAAVGRVMHMAADSRAFDGLVIAGDYNLVGSRDPLEILAAGLDLDGSALAIAEAYQLDRRTNATWSDPSQPFVPGRLDYMIYADAGLNLARTFVLDARDLPDQWRRHHGIEPTDTELASDHLPLVADFTWPKQP